MHVADEALSSYQTSPQSVDYWKQKAVTEVWNRDEWVNCKIIGKYSHYIANLLNKVNVRMTAMQVITLY